MTKAEMEQGFQRIWDLFAETDKKFEETDKRIERSDKKHDRQVQKWRRNFEKSRQENQRRDEEWHRKFEARSQENEKHLEALRYLSQRTDAKVDALTGKWGRFVEGLVIPAVERLFCCFGNESAISRNHPIVHKR